MFGHPDHGAAQTPDVTKRNGRSLRVSICIFVAICVANALKSSFAVARRHLRPRGNFRRTGTAVAKHHSRGVPKKHVRIGRRVPRGSTCLRIEGRHMRFILVNGRTLSRRTFCMLCSRPIGTSYLREFRTALSFCGHDCYALYCDRWIARVSHPTCSAVAANPRPSAGAKARGHAGPQGGVDNKQVHHPVKPADPSRS